MAKPTASTMDKITALCKRRGFIFQSSEIYGGIGGFWDYGPLGTELKRNVKDAWCNDMVRNPPPGPDGREFQMVGLDCSIIMNPKVWEASGHVGGFNDPRRDCRDCNLRYRADFLVRWMFRPVDHVPTGPQLIHDAIRDSGDTVATFLSDWEPGSNRDSFTTAAKRALGVKKLKWIDVPQADGPIPDAALWYCEAGNRKYFVGQTVEQGPLDGDKCPNCGGMLTEPRDFNLMLESHTGAVRDDASKVYLRPETAQGIFVNFKNVMDSSRVKLPLGIAQIGKSFRNEINPRNYTFRSREFEQYEIEFFCHPSEAAVWYEFWRDLRYQWYVTHGLKSDKLRLRNHEGDELAHYAQACADVEYEFPFGISELEGIANRTDFDLKAHMDKSGKDLSHFDPHRGEKGERYVPYVIEPSGGVDRSVLAFITEAYTVDQNRASPELLKFHPRLA
ncbi:MAG: glycine--tRNA ligase, partial [Phycisphaerae bacterium]